MAGPACRRRRAGLRDRSSRPHLSPTRLGEAAEAEILALRRQRLTGPAIACRLRRPLATVGLVLRRHGLCRLAALEPKPEIVRYQLRAAGLDRRADTGNHRALPDPPEGRQRS
ncbi:MAG: hypothetical protein U1E52_12695 [Geminicoccaceae bacterium]